MVCLWCGRSVGRSVTWLPNFLGWVDLFTHGAPLARSRAELRFNCSGNLAFSEKAASTFFFGLTSMPLVKVARCCMELYRGTPPVREPWKRIDLFARGRSHFRCITRDLKKMVMLGLSVSFRSIPPVRATRCVIWRPRERFYDIFVLCWCKSCMPFNGPQAVLKEKNNKMRSIVNS